MSNPYVGEIRVFATNFAPAGWALCDGSILPIKQNTALFSLLGTSYGGDGSTTFALPNLRGVFPLGQGAGLGLTTRTIGETGGEASVTLVNSQLPSHTHTVNAASVSGAPGPGGNNFGSIEGRGKAGAYAPYGSSHVAMSLSAVSIAGANQPHENRPPFLVLNFCIALQGVFPPRP
jgi:microcystin-dependent protein